MAVWRGIREIVSLIAHCQLDWPAALAGDAPDIVAAGNVCLEIEVFAVNGPAKSEHGTRIVESINVQRTISRAGRARDGIARQFRGGGGKPTLLPEENAEKLKRPIKTSYGARLLAQSFLAKKLLHFFR